MTLTFDVTNSSTRLSDMLAEIEAGHDVVLAQNAKPVAELPTIAPDTVDAAITSLRENRKNFARSASKRS